jgi:hypothetical protein
LTLAARTFPCGRFYFGLGCLMVAALSGKPVLTFPNAARFDFRGVERKTGVHFSERRSVRSNFIDPVNLISMTVCQNGASRNGTSRLRVASAAVLQ